MTITDYLDVLNIYLELVYRPNQKDASWSCLLFSGDISAHERKSVYLANDDVGHSTTSLCGHGKTADEAIKALLKQMSGKKIAIIMEGRGGGKQEITTVLNVPADLTWAGNYTGIR